VSERERERVNIERERGERNGIEWGQRWLGLDANVMSEHRRGGN